MTTQRIKAPSLLAPKADAVLPNGAVNWQVRVHWHFDWSDVPKATRYHLQVTGPTATLNLIDAKLPRSEFEHESTGYIAGRNRFGWQWKVRAQVDGEWGPWSERRLFNVGELQTGPDVQKPQPGSGPRSTPGPDGP